MGEVPVRHDRHVDLSLLDPDDGVAFQVTLEERTCVYYEDGRYEEVNHGRPGFGAEFVGLWRWNHVTKDVVHRGLHDKEWYSCSLETKDHYAAYLSEKLLKES